LSTAGGMEQNSGLTNNEPSAPKLDKKALRQAYLCMHLRSSVYD
jgi:hypothetical protein